MAGDFSNIGESLKQVYNISTTSGLRYCEEQGARAYKDKRCLYCSSLRIEGRITCTQCGGPY